MTFEATLSGIFIADNADSLVSRRVPSVRVLENGFEGDKHQGWFRKADVRAKRYPKGTKIWNSRQISIVSESELAKIAMELGVPKTEPEWLGANICIKDTWVLLSLLNPRTKIYIPNEEGGPDVGFYVTAQNKPCIHPGNVIENYYISLDPVKYGHLACKFLKAAEGRRGLVAVVEHPGVIRQGAKVSVVVE